MKTSIHIIDKELEALSSQNELKDYRLSVLINEDFSYVIEDTKTGKYLLLSEYMLDKKASKDLKNIFETDNWLSKKYKQVHIAIDSDASTLVPNEAFDSTNLKDYLLLNVGSFESQEEGADDIQAANTKNVYAIDATTKKIMLSHFGKSAKVLHAETALLQTILVENKDGFGKKVFLNIKKNSFNIIVLEKGKLLLDNTFKMHTPEDVLYYILLTYQSLKLDPEIISVNLLGKTEKDDAIHSLLKKYIARVNFGRRPNTFKYSYKFGKVDEHRYYNLLGINSCA